MSVRAVLAVVIALGAGGTATAVPLLVDGPFLTLDLPTYAPVASSSGHAGHSGHGGASHAPATHATHSAGGSTVHVTHGDAGDGDTHSGHADAASGEASGEVDWHNGAHGDHAGGLGEQPGMQRPAFPPATGKVPSSPDGLKQMSTTRLLDDDAVAKLATKGSGTLSDPYVIRGFYFTGELELRDTDACVVIAENWFDFQLSLNWNGQCVWVHHNYIWDLRVNENNLRTGYGTGGLMEQNEIVIIGQLRHYDGEFRHNVVGPAPPDALLEPVQETTPLLFGVSLVANIDGFNQGWIHHNTFHGPVDLDFHGHHHGTGFFAPHSHYHGDSSSRQAEHMHDHSDRWTSVAFTDNTIVDPEDYGLRYEDANHAGDDRRANSEDMDVLSKPHQHHTDIVLARNRVTGGQIWVDIFNADDSLHKERNPGTLTIADNVVETHERSEDVNGEYCFVRFSPSYNGWTGIHVETAKEVLARVTGNTLTYVALPTDTSPLGTVRGLVEQARETCSGWPAEERVPTAIRFVGIRDSQLLVEGNKASGFQVGVLASSMDGDTVWRVVGNDFGTAKPVRYDDSVANAPVTT